MTQTEAKSRVYRKRVKRSHAKRLGPELTGPNSGITARQIYQYVGYLMIVDASATLFQAVYKYESRLRQLQSWNTIKRAEAFSLETYHSRHEDEWLEGVMGLGKSDAEHLTTYWKIRRRRLGTFFMLGWCLQPMSADVSEATRRCQAGNLYSINSMLYDLRNDDETAGKFLMDLVYKQQNSYSAAEEVPTEERKAQIKK